MSSYHLAICYNKKTKQTSVLNIINFKKSRDQSDKKSWNKLLMVLQHSSVGKNPYIGMPWLQVTQSYVVIPLAITTSNLFHNFLSLGSLELIMFNTLVCFW